MAAKAWYVITDTTRKMTWVIQDTLTGYKQNNHVDPASIGVQGQTDNGFPTRQAAQAAEAAFDKANGYKSQGYLSAEPGLGSTSNPFNNLGSSLGDSLGLSGITSFLSKLTEPVFWLRAAEIIIGAAMIIIGVGRITGMGQQLTEIGSKAAVALA